jgi:hypothetical protein
VKGEENRERENGYGMDVVKIGCTMSAFAVFTLMTNSKSSALDGKVARLGTCEKLVNQSGVCKAVLEEHQSTVILSTLSI